MTTILESKELKDTKASINAGMESLMKRVIRQTMTPAEKEAKDREDAQKARDAALMWAIAVNNRFWWIFNEDHFDEGGDLAYHDLEWRAGGVGWWRIVGNDPTVFELFQQMDLPHRTMMLNRMLRAELPQTIHPMQLTDLATGEYTMRAA